MESLLDPYAAQAALAWQIELGATDAICDAPVNRYELPDRAPDRALARAGGAVPGNAPGGAKPAPIFVAPVQEDPVADARAAAAACDTLQALQAAVAGFDHCELKKGARNTVFADGVAGARVMIIGEAPGRDEDREGRPFVGRAGQLLDRMLGAIGLSRAESVYITNVLPWRPPQNRTPRPDEIAMMKPFLERHVALAKPEILVLTGNSSCNAVLGQGGITRIRGHWTQAMGLPILPMLHPAYLLRTPQAKRDTWADLLALQARLRDGS